VYPIEITYNEVIKTLHTFVEHRKFIVILVDQCLFIENEFK